MIHFLKILSVLIIPLSIINGFSSSLEEAASAEGLQTARSLQEVYDRGARELENRLATWRSLKDGKDVSAKNTAKKSLEDLRKDIAIQCCALTGLNLEWGTSNLRIRQGFFTEAHNTYDKFACKLIDTLQEHSIQGKLSQERGILYGTLLAQAGQRAAFYRDAFSMLSEDGAQFKIGGVGGFLANVTGGFTESVSEAFGKYFYSQNTNLALLMVSKEDIDVAGKIASLFKLFHEPLGIQGDVPYMLSLEGKIAQRRSAFEGDLSLLQVQTYLAEKPFWDIKADASTTDESESSASSSQEEKVERSSSAKPSRRTYAAVAATI